MSELLRVEHLQAEPGCREDGFLTVAEMQDGSPVRLPVSLINGAQAGPTLYLQAISDGDELNGVAVIRQVLKRESRHFGALSGLGLILQDIGDDKQALEVYRRTLKIYPRIERIPDLVKELTVKVEGRDI